jgi:hypothetical protein
MNVMLTSSSIKPPLSTDFGLALTPLAPLSAHRLDIRTHAIARMLAGAARIGDVSQAQEAVGAPTRRSYFCFRRSFRMASSASMTSSRLTRALAKFSFRLNALVGGR